MSSTDRLRCDVVTEWVGDFSQCLFEWQSLAGGVLAIVCLITFPWETLLVVAALYVGMIPVSALQYLRYKRLAEVKPDPTQ